MRLVLDSKSIFLTIILSGLFLSLEVFTQAAPADLDTTFGSGGKVTTNTGNWDYLSAIAIQSDGKIVAIGNSLTIGDTFAAVRYNTDGTLDTSFDGDGVSIIQALPGIPEAVAIQPDGKIVMVGRLLTGPAPGFTVARLNVNGSLDTSFDGDGFVITQIGTGPAYAFAVGLQPDGKIVVGGNSYSGSDSNLTAARYHTDGSLDSSFDGDGIVINTLAGYDDRASALKIQPDGKLLFAGQRFFFNSGSDFEVIRYKSDGTLDASFDGDGIVTTSIGTSGLDDLQALVLQPDGKIIAAGASFADGRYVFTAVRYHSDGALDAGFDQDGIVTTGVGTNSVQVYDMNLQQNGKIVLTGWTFTGQSDDFAVVRYESNGSLDMGFGDGGIVITSIGIGNDKAYGMGIQSDGKIVVAGWTHNGVNYDYGLVRYLGDPVAARRSAFDFDGDGKTDLAIFRPAGGEWWYRKSSDNAVLTATFGNAIDKPVPADFTGDGRADIAFWRPATGEWFILRSEDGSFYAFPFGASGDVPVVGDFDGDGRADPGVFRPSSATWFIQKSSGGVIIQAFGASSDKPIPADYDGDGKTDLAIFRPNAPAGAEWWHQRSSTGQIAALQFGSSTDKAVPGDYTGDGKADIAFFQPSTGNWFVLRSEDFSYYAFPFGAAGDVPVPGDYDGDGRADAAVFRASNATWFIQCSSAGTAIQQFGASGDVPIPTVFVP